MKPVSTEEVASKVVSEANRLSTSQLCESNRNDGRSCALQNRQASRVAVTEVNYVLEHRPGKKHWCSGECQAIRTFEIFETTNV